MFLLLYYVQVMKQYIQTMKEYIVQKNETFIGAGVVLVLVGIVAAIALVVDGAGPNVVYQPAKACELLTPTEAQDLLGDRVINVEKNEPIITENTATSKCSYTDHNADASKMMVAAVAVRTGINDEGVLQNKSDFAQARSSSAGEDVKGVGESAYFNPELGQLNVLDGNDWVILSYGIGEAPEANTVEKAIELARKVIE